MAERIVLDLQSEIERALDCLSVFAPQLPDGLKPLLKLAPPKGMHAQVGIESDGVRISYTPSSLPLPDVRKGLEQKAADFGFAPVTIPGEPLSATVLRERR